MKLSLHRQFAALWLTLILLAAGAWAQAPAAAPKATTGGLHGQVTDPSGAVVVGAVVTVTSPDGQSQKATSDKQGNYSVRGLASGSVTVDAVAAGFSAYHLSDVIIPAGQAQQLDIAFGIAVKQEQVTVQSESATVDLSPSNNASATVLKDKDLEALSDDPDQLEQDLLALAGPSAGPNGGQIYIDGFSNGTLPPKSSIREIRINQNPFSAEYDRPGFGRVEVFTKPGTDKWHGQAMFNENNSVLNSRNPYITGSVPDYHSEMYTGNIGGAAGKKGSLFFNFERRNINETSAIDATVLDGSGVPTPYTTAILAPRTRTNLSPRFDYQLAPGNTLTARYQYFQNDEQNQGLSAFTLSSRAYAEHETQHQLQISDTQILNPHLINETRFQFIHDTSSTVANEPTAVAINVPGFFLGGGSTVGNTVDHIARYELQNYTSLQAGKHFVKFGGRLRISSDDNSSNSNFNGTVTYTSLANYQAGLASRYSYATGTPQASLSFADVGLYAEDDWKLRPNLTLSYGLRLESQSAISDHADFAPRVGLSWGLGSAKSTPKTVLRLGYGIFYDRFTQDLVLQADRQNGVLQQQYIYAPVAGAAGIPCTIVNSQPVCDLAGSAATNSPTIYQINPSLRAPYTSQAAASLERQLGKVGTVSVTYLNSRGLHQLITENINAPTECFVATATEAAGCYDNSRALYSKYGVENVYQYNSEAMFKQNQLITNLNLRVSQKLSLMGFYALGYAKGNSAGAAGTPSNQFNLHEDYGRTSFDVRHRVFLSGTIQLSHYIRISPFVIINSGTPFNIVTGTDLNGDSFDNDRPALASVTGQTNPLYLKSTSYGVFDLNPSNSAARIPINYAVGPANVSVNLRVSKTFGFGAETKKDNSPQSSGGDPGGRGGRGGPGGGFGAPKGMGGLFGPSNTTRRYNLTITAMARNLFNTWNPGTPIGNLSSSSFGKSNSLAGGPFSSGSANRRVDLQATFSF